MSISQLARRIARVGQDRSPDPDGGLITLEELCRSIWRHDKAKFREIAQPTSGMLLIAQFEHEDAMANKVQAVVG